MITKDKRQLPQDSDEIYILTSRAVDKYFLGETDSYRWHFYHHDARIYYESDNSQTITRLKSQKSKLTFVDE